MVFSNAGVLDYAEGTGRDIIRAQTEKKLKETVSESNAAGEEYAVGTTILQCHNLRTPTLEISSHTLFLFQALPTLSLLSRESLGTCACQFSYSLVLGALPTLSRKSP